MKTSFNIDLVKIESCTILKNNIQVITFCGHNNVTSPNMRIVWSLKFNFFSIVVMNKMLWKLCCRYGRMFTPLMYSPCLFSFGHTLIHWIFNPCFAFFGYHCDVVGMFRLYVKQIHYFINCEYGFEFSCMCI